MIRLSEPFLRLTDVAYRYEQFALDKQSVSLERGELLVILGPSGSGKTTLLQLIAGLLTPREGSIVMDGKPIHRLPPERRGLSMIFQKPYLLPFLTVGANVEIGLRLQGMRSRERKEKTEAILNKVGLSGFYHRPISSLSGGQEQRVALARSLVIEPRLLLLDEPFSQLDPLLRKQMGRWLAEMKRQSDIPMILVTHDREEALTLGDKFLVLRDGAAQQSGELHEVYGEPANRWVADFMGFENVLSGIKRGAAVRTILGESEIHPRCASLPDGPVAVPVRSEWLRLDEASPAKAVIEDRVFRGEYTEVTALIGGEKVVVKQLGYSNEVQGTETGIRLAKSPVWCLSKEEE